MGDEELTPSNFIERIKNMDTRKRGKLTAEKLLSLIIQTDIRVEPNIQLAEIRASIDLVTKLATANQGEIAALKAENVRLTTANNELRQETRALRRTIDELKDNNDNNNPENNITSELKEIRNQINDIEQYLRVNNLEVVGLPQPGQGETEEKVLIEAFNSLNGIDIVVEPDDIDISHPLNSRRQDGKPVHVVGFISRKTKEAIISARKKETNRQYAFRGKDIYINEHLSKQNRSLFASAQETKRTLNYKYCWTRGGSVKLRKTDTSDTITVTSEEQLAALQE